jgi:uncharacterized protein YecT (DUF1311 family)
MKLMNLVRAAPLLVAAHAFAAPPVDCAAAVTPADLEHCAYEDFLAAGAAYSAQYQALAATLPAPRKDQLRRMQKAWLGFQKAACDFETNGRGRGAAHWQCMARLTRERSEQLGAPSR